ncbi:MAG: hypothetical protein JKY88_17690 [Pseudomonadales bacterium]|nr:hypothetical protein [Pseudomonadales bacterium]
MTGDFWIIDNDHKRQAVIDYINKVWPEKKWLQIQIKDGAASTPNQRDWMHPVFREIAKVLAERSGMDYSEGWVKTNMKRRFGITNSLPDPVTKNPVPYLVSTEKYTRGEKCQFMEQVLEWAASIEITIDPPEQYKKMQREQIT